jgi:hypothetical protein
VNPGSVFQISGDGYHFHIVLSQPLNGLVLVCNISDLEHFSESTCPFDQKDHEWFTKPSGLILRRLKTLPIAGFERAIANREIRASTKLITPEKLKEACDFILAATSVREKWKSYLR